MKNYLKDGEQELFSGSADKLIAKNLRKGTVSLKVTNQRVIVGGTLKSTEYLLDDIVSAERFKAMLMNIGITFHLKDGTTVDLATSRIKALVEVLTQLGKM